MVFMGLPLTTPSMFESAPLETSGADTVKAT
jgi:hypothetical protein